MAYTQEELVSIINTYIIDNNILAINPAKMREVLIAIATSMNTGGSSSPTARAPIYYDPFTNTFTFKSLGVTAFGTNDYTATIEGLTSLETGYYFLATFENPNTGVARMNLNGLTDEPIVKNYNTPVDPGDLTGTIILMYNLDKWVVVGSVGSGGGGGVAAVWGSITGTLSAQTDLQSALNAKQAALTETVLGALINGLTAKTTLVDTDLTDLVDSADSNKSKKITWLNVWNYIKSKADLIYSALNPRLQTVTSSATVTPTSLNDLVIITAQAVNLTLANPSGTFAEGQALMIRIKDNGTARSITFGSNYRAIGITLPTTTVISKTLYLGIIYNDVDDKWDVLGINLQA